ncbi:MAG TPA: type II toxin-antitoxin system Phd/YefM family antitoxin [Azospirillum sp.]
MRTVPANDFCRNFGRYQNEAQREPVAVTSDGRTAGVFISADEYAHYQTLRKREREVLTIGELPDDVRDAIMSAEYPPGHEDLDSLLDDPHCIALDRRRRVTSR